MGNIVQCCHTLSKYFKCKDALAHGEAERSPLLSSEDSECEWPSMPDDIEDHLLTLSSGGGKNPSLEPEHFLFPDIILSSNLGGDVILVEPMVCLLVSEEDDGAKVDEPRDERQESFNRWRNRVFLEVETQTEVETQIFMGVQTQTESQEEVQAPTEIHACNEREVNTLRDDGNKEMVVVELETPRQVGVLLEAQTSQDFVTKMASETQKKRIDSGIWADMDVFEKQTKRNKLASRDVDKKAEQKELITPNSTKCIFETKQNTKLIEELNTDEGNSFKLQKAIHENVTKPESTSVMPTEHHNNMDEDIGSQKEIQSTKCSINNTKVVENFDPAECRVDLTQQSHPNIEQLGQKPVESDQTVNEKVCDVIHTKNNMKLSEDHTDQSDLNADHIQWLDPVKKEEDDHNKTAPPHEEEEEAEMKQALFLVDRLFVAAPHVKVPPSQTEEKPEDDRPQQCDTDESKVSIRDVVALQETDFTVRILPPGKERFELQVSGQMLVAELHQVLMEHEISCHCTCFSFQLRGITLDSLTELRSIQGIQDGALIKVVEDSYTVRDARLHLRHVRDLLRSLDPADAYNGVNCSSLSYLTFFTRGDKDSDSVGNRRASEKESADCSPPDYILPGCKERPLTPLHPLRDDWKPLQCLRVLTMSSWNPPPGNRKMHGDLMYLNVLTMEDKELNITSSTRGFYLNQSTTFNFNPKPALPKILCHSLVELLSQVSPAFRKTFSALQKKRLQQHPYEQIAAPFQVFTWIARHGDHTLDCVRAEETHTSRMGQDEQTAGQSRDWNEELQGCRELARTSLQERLHRERNIFKTNSDFVAAATRGAVAVIDGNVMPLNPGEAPHMQMFIWNNLFFSLGFDISEHYSPLGGNTAAHAAAVCDLRGAQAYASVDVEGLHTLGTAVVDYRGIRVITQTIVPGILEKNQEQTVVYGSNDYGKTVFTHPRFLELLDKTSEPLRIQRHQVLDHSNSPVELCSGIETKGILGNDGRAYILDLLRTFPPDLNFQFSETEESREVPKECQIFGYPRRHRHSLASLRPELMEAFIQHRYELYLKLVSQDHIRTEEHNKAMEQRIGDQATSGADIEFQRRNVIMKACKAVGSVSDSCFDIRFNPDVCSPGVCFPSECVEEVQRQRQLLWDAAAFLLSNQIPAVLKDCLDHSAVPMDGATLTSVLHQRGVNVRYLCTLLRELDSVEDKGRLSHIQRISISEVIIRSAKHIFRTYLQDVEPAAFSAAVSHFLNCLLSSSSCFADFCSDELLSRRRSRRRRSNGSRVALLTDSVWARLTPSELWGRIRTEAGDYYHYTIDSENIDEVIKKHGLQRISLLREMAIKTGIQVQLREYVFESRHRPVFAEEDVVNMFPVVKHLKPTATDATRLVQHAQVAVQQGLLKDGHELISRALTLFSGVCGVLHEDVCMCLRLLGRTCYILGEYADALSHQEKAVMSSERIQGIDHPQTIQDYTYLALYCFAGGRHSTSLQLLYRARYLTLLVSGEDHPQVALLDSMLGLVLHGLTEYELSLKFLKNALTSTSKYHGATSLKHAQSHHLLATVYEIKGEFRSALQHEKEALSIYKSQFATSSFPAILQQLNLTCGINSINLSAKECEDLNTETEGNEKVQWDSWKKT
ncbi:clustered mitochondria protein homolog isoform X2 [Clinocottus analis]|uniref:clustered mitochondria protein homolog isoform X2 n=1 Tax=Clinocottus analis TaxID=304258 RepID=UPI0035C0E10B